jgi:succinate dehydrogenase / fumarate reductase membrane anchor subunit
VRGAVGWLFQRLTGLVLIAGLLLHFSTMHFSGPQQVTYEVVLRRISNPLWKTFDLFFLAVILSHGFYGLWGIALEYIRSAKLLKLFQGVILVSVCVLLITGIYIITL